MLSPMSCRAQSAGNEDRVEDRFHPRCQIACPVAQLLATAHLPELTQHQTKAGNESTARQPLVSFCNWLSISHSSMGWLHRRRTGRMQRKQSFSGSVQVSDWNAWNLEWADRMLRGLSVYLYLYRFQANLLQGSLQAVFERN